MYRLALRRSSQLTKIQTNDARILHARRLWSSPPGAPREAGFGKFLVILSPLAAAGGVLAYAKYDEGFRKSLVATFPALESTLNTLLDDKGISKTLEDTKSSVFGLFGGKEEPMKKENIVPPPLVRKPPKPTQSDATIPVPEPTPPPKSAAPPRASSPARPAPKSESFEIPKTVLELEVAVEAAAATAAAEYQKAAEIFKKYNEEVRKVVDSIVDHTDTASWSSLKNRTSARNSAVRQAEELAQEAATKLETLEKALKNNVSQASTEVYSKVRETQEKARNTLNAAKTELFKARELSNMSEKYWKKVEDARNHFVSEMESLFPGINVTERQLDLPKDQLDLFLLYAYSHVLAYQKELQKLHVEGEERLKRVLNSLQSNDREEMLEAELNYRLEKERRDMALAKQKELFEIRQAGERKIREALKQQAQAHVDSLNETLKLKEQEIRRVLTRESDEKLLKEKTSYATQLAEMVGKVKGMDATLKARAEAEEKSQKARGLWSACQALWLCVRQGENNSSWRDGLVPLEGAVSAVDKASAENDKVVKTILGSLSKEALTRGVYPEEALRERFLKVDRLARRLALVPEDGARLPMYILSYLQSMFILTPDNPVSKEELKDEIVDFSKLDTYDILNRARYWMERGNLTQTLRYMNLLQGAPRKVASDWLKECRLYLETQQAINTLMSHAATTGLMYL
ncbi:MICOS complex subunit Mic60 isoform X2 [Phlebotomus argentipes]|uniref:MICOS complex subunit Mic60 isoform X2 n=1 Tax=Phlebotomus argentipes TaxID=94469 RepID=UPI002892CD6A|nr:MICOS complex subunit Mic60 isoform X2 [Phlebotomus argentipes]